MRQQLDTHQLSQSIVALVAQIGQLQVAIAAPHTQRAIDHGHSVIDANIARAARDQLQVVAVANASPENKSARADSRQSHRADSTTAQTQTSRRRPP